MKNKIKKSTLLAIIVLTLLLHLVFLYFFTTVPFSSAPDRISEFIDRLLGNTPEQPEEKPQLMSHAPQQSAPVIFRDEPEEEPIKQQPLPPEPPKTLVSHAANPLNKPAEIKEKECPAIKNDVVKKEEKKIEITKHDPQPLDIEPENLDEENQTVFKEEITQPELEKKNPNDRKPEPLSLANHEKTPVKIKKQITQKKNSSSQPESIVGNTKQGKSTSKKSTPPLSLAQLSQQFMQKMATVETGGHGALRVEGNAAYGHPSAYQIALERYVAKMCTEIETAYRIGTNQSVQGTQHKPFNLLVELNSTGALNTIYPSPSSGLARIDEFAISIFKSASKSFPKLPEAMGSSLRIQFGINHIDNLAQLSQGILTSR